MKLCPLILWISALTIPTSNLDVRAAPTSRIPLWVEAVGDSGLTERLADAIVRAASRSSHFVPTYSRRAGTIYLDVEDSISTHVHGDNWVTAKIVIADSFTATKPLRSGTVKCWDGSLEVCAIEALKMVPIARGRNSN